MAGLKSRPVRFRMPAEWEPHEATWLAWPHERSDWPGKFAPIPWLYGDIVRCLSRVEKVRILVNDKAAEQSARRVLAKCGANLNAVEFFHHRTNRSWARDYCPIFVRDSPERAQRNATAAQLDRARMPRRPVRSKGRLTITNWIFNGWAKYDNWHDDNQIPEFVARQLKIPQVEPGIVLEGGSIDVNGAGLLLTTEECLLSERVQVRNPGFSRADWERCFAKFLGVRRIIWLKNGIAGDDTHGHVDDTARFVDPETIVTVVERDRSDANYEPLHENLALLTSTGLRIVTLPMPAPIWFDGQRLPASYANFYIANGMVLVPVFNDPMDRVALNTLARLFPGREVAGIYSRDLVLGLGTLHCMTMQQPA